MKSRYNKEKKHLYYLKNKEIIKSKVTAFYKENIESKKEYSKKYYNLKKTDPEFILKRKAYAKEYRKNNKEKKRIFINNLKATNSNYRLRENMSTQIWYALRNKKAGRKWESIVGYSIKDLIAHLESKFHLDKNISWNNYGTYWHIDHIKPRSLFDFTDEKQIRECWKLSNLQPLEAIANKKKSHKYSICPSSLT